MTSIDTLPLYVISADSLARAGLVALLNGVDGCSVTVQGGLESLSDTLFDADPPAVVVWDVGWESDIQDEDIADVLELRLPVVVLLSDAERAPRFIHAGIQGVLLRNVPLGQIVAAVRAVHEELIVIDPDVSAVLFANGNTAVLAADLLEPLTPRENEVLNLLAQGLTNKAIGATLDISPHTVKFHVTAIMEKLDAQSRTEAVVQATRLGLLRF